MRFSKIRQLVVKRSVLIERHATSGARPDEIGTHTHTCACRESGRDECRQLRSKEWPCNGPPSEMLPRAESLRALVRRAISLRTDWPRHVDQYAGVLCSLFGRLRFFEDGWGRVALAAELTRVLSGATHPEHLPRGEEHLLARDGAGPAGSGYTFGLDELRAATRQQAADIELNELFMRSLRYRLHMHRLRAQNWTAYEGTFQSPSELLVPGILPEESRTARFLLVAPRSASHAPLEEVSVPVVCVLAGTGDHSYMRRLHNVAMPLARRGVASVLVESPYYGARKPCSQVGARLRQVADLFVLGFAQILETMSILHWLQCKQGRDVCLAGYSQGGLHAAMVASLVREPVKTVLAFAPHSAEFVFTDGVLGRQVDWHALQRHEFPLGKRAHGRAGNGDGERGTQWHQLAALLRMTDIRFFPNCERHDQAVLLFGDSDAYIAADSVRIWKDRWPHAEIQVLPTGHVGGILFETQALQNAVLKALGVRDQYGVA
ncbi:Protein ABHD18 [Porphyridium purpureum]|uniref:Protein ABHD18 n=1 Tax=Porphyridium purpureum TaxID=35688 RepID=A0A5J4YPR3_PORPP|nr:Protein ABHD18 [Porphyridium purpureum]|eukprot:POR6768..scf222_8